MTKLMAEILFFFSVNNYDKRKKKAGNMKLNRSNCL